MAISPYALRLIRRILAAEGIASRVWASPAGALHYYDAPGGGSLPQVVVLHGIGSSASAFAGVLRALRPHVRRVVAADAPGHGLSDAPASRLTPDALYGAVLEWFDGAVEGPAVVFGNSLGGALALRLALDRPARVLGVVASSPGGARSSPAELARLLAEFELRDARQARAFVRRLYHRAPWYTPLLAMEVRALMKRDAIRQFFAACTVEDTFRGEELGAIRAPVLLLWGGSERLLPEEHLAFYRAHLPRHAIVERPEGFGHSPQLERPRDLAARIARFAAEVPATTG